MKLREIKDIVDFYDDIKQTEELLDKEVTLMYYWYHHMIDRKVVDEMNKAVKNKDFDKFIELRNKYNGLPSTDGEPLEFLPQYADVVTEEDYDYIGRVDVTVKSNFDKITDSDYECG